jgi:hypothetical protein
MPLDHVPPVVRTDLSSDASGSVTVHARVHSNKRYLPGELPTIEVMWDDSGDLSAPLGWYGEHLFRATVEVPAGATGLRVCATDDAGNQSCVQGS